MPVTAADDKSGHVYF